jgi:hypothetical protein
VHNKSYETLSSGDNHLQCFTLLKEKLLEFLIGIQINNNDYYDYIENPVNYTIHLQLTDIIKPGRAVNAVTYHTTRLIQDGFILEPANPPTIVTIIVSNSLNPSFFMGIAFEYLKMFPPTLSYNFILLAKCVGDIFEYRFAIC